MLYSFKLPPVMIMLRPFTTCISLLSTIYSQQRNVIRKCRDREESHSFEFIKGAAMLNTIDSRSLSQSDRQDIKNRMSNNQSGKAALGSAAILKTEGYTEGAEPQ